MKNQSKEIFIPGPSGRIQAQYFKSQVQGSPVALVLQPHPQYGGTMNNRIVYETYNCFLKNNFSVVRINVAPDLRAESSMCLMSFRVYSWWSGNGW